MFRPQRILALLFSITLSLFILLRICTERGSYDRPADHELPQLQERPAAVADLNGRNTQLSSHALEDATPCMEGRDREIDLLAQALRGRDAGEVQAAAAELRSQLRGNPARLAELFRRLLEPTTPLREFASLALVAGSLGDETSMDQLLAALGRFQNDPDRAEWILYALGTYKERPGWDARFGFDARGPMVLETEDGLRTPLFHEFTNRRAIRQLLPFLGESNANLRSAAILTLRHSLTNPEVREAFADTLVHEKDYGNQANLSEALARISADLPLEQKQALASRLLDRAVQPDGFAIRLKVESPLKGLPLDEPQQNLLANLATSPDLADSSTRRFALALLADQHALGDNANPILWKAATDDPEPAIRAAAIEHLRSHPVPPSPSRLIPILDSDPDWNVRYAAVETLAHIPSEDEAHNALNALKTAARQDPHPEVAARARAILQGQ